jgi:deoxyribose-phosphate aldolase
MSGAPAAASHERNPGTPLDLGWVTNSTVNRSAIERRAATHLTRRSVKKQWQLAWLLRGIACCDLTTLAGDDTEGNVERLCAKARMPIRKDMLDKCGLPSLKVGAVCVYPARVKDAVHFLQGTGIPVASVATGFPSGQIILEHKLAEIRRAVEDGALEIDIVISRAYVLRGEWQKLYDEVKAFRAACGPAHMKAILETGELATYTQVYQASIVCMMAGSDFIKTSTGKAKTNANLEVGFIMVRAIRDYYERTGVKVGFKPAGGIRSAKDTLYWLSMMKDELGDEWTQPDLFRMGVSALVPDIERQIWHGLTGEYAGSHYIPMG